MSAFPPEYIRAHLAALGCDPARVEESFIHSGGAGGQNVNKVATCVQLRYAPRNLLVKMQEHRTQSSNRVAAWKLLASQLERLREREAAERQAARERKRRQNAQRPRGVKKQFVEMKRRRAKTKSGRGSVDAEE
jgi:protein subunit release factor B